MLAIIHSPITWIVAFFGLNIGSFFNVCIYRIPEKSFFSKARSACRHCGAAIPFYHNIPVLSFLILRGKSACCHKPISWQYPLVEILTAIMFVAVYWKFPFVEFYNNAIKLDPANLIRFVHALIFVSILIICSVIDLHHMIIPDVLSLPMIALTPVVVFFHPDLRWLDALIGVFAGGGFLYLVAWIYWIWRKEIGMGMGDVKLLAGIGGWLGYQSVFPTIFYGSIIGTFAGVAVMIAKRQATLRLAIPFGPFLAIGSILFLFFGSTILYMVG